MSDWHFSMLSKIVSRDETMERNWKGNAREYILGHWNVSGDTEVLVLWENEQVNHDVSPENEATD